MSDPKRDLTYRKSRFKIQARAASTKISRLFRKVALGGDMEIDDVYNLACLTVELGGKLQDIAQAAMDLDMASEVSADLAKEALKLEAYSAGLKSVAQAYFRLPVKALPVYEPSLPKKKEEAKVVKKSIKGMIEDLGGVGYGGTHDGQA